MKYYVKFVLGGEAKHKEIAFGDLSHLDMSGSSCLMQVITDEMIPSYTSVHRRFTPIG